jgi:uncharacterized damage-inducible protein DinB
MSSQTADSTTARSAVQIAFADLEKELATTRKVIERIPEDQFAWKPHEKSFNLGALATHVANLVGFQSQIMESDGIDRAAVPRDLNVLTKSEILARLDENTAKAKAALARLTDADLERPWTFRAGDRVFFSSPKSAALRNAGINHMIHHRAQLGVYLRLLGVPVPGSYGPTADEPF